MNTQLLNTPGARILALMFHRGMKRDDVARAIGASGAFVSQLTGNQKNPSVDTLVKLASALRTTTDYLLMRTDNPDVPDFNRAHAPAFATVEAVSVARIVDGLPDAERSRVMAVVAAMAGAAVHANVGAGATSGDAGIDLVFGGDAGHALVSSVMIATKRSGDTVGAGGR